jgi:hypothetical protein
MNSLEELKKFVHGNAALSRTELESLMMRHYQPKHSMRCSWMKLNFSESL